MLFITLELPPTPVVSFGFYGMLSYCLWEEGAFVGALSLVATPIISPRQPLQDTAPCSLRLDDALANRFFPLLCRCSAGTWTRQRIVALPL